MPDSVILTSFFSKKIHPNSPQDPHVVGRKNDGRIENSFSYIKDWYNSIIKNNLFGVVFYDDLSEDFIKSYENKNINFIKVEDSEYSNLDYRHFCSRDYLLTNKFKYVFHSDVSDVVVVKDPSELIKDNDSFTYFACKDSIKLNEFPYINVHEKFNWEDKVMFLLNENSWDLINMGVVGGRYEDMLNFYQKYCEIREKMGEKEFGQADMWIVQYLLRSIFRDKNTLIGDPMCSEFKKYQKERKDVYFIHK